MPLEDVDQLREIGQRAGQPVDLVDDDAVDPAGLDVGEQALQRRALQRGAADTRRRRSGLDERASPLALALDVGLAGRALGVEGVELLLQALLAGFPGVDRAADLGLDLGPAHPPLPVLRRPKNSGPDHWVPVIARATAERLR